MIKNLIIKSKDILKQYEIAFQILLIYVISLPIMKTPNLPFFSQRIQFSEIIFIFLFFLWIRNLIKNKKLPQDSGINRPFLFFIAFCVLSFFHSANLLLSAIELSGLIYLFIMLILITDIVDSKIKLNAIVKVWIGALSVVLALGLMGWVLCIITKKANIFCWANFGIFPYHEKFSFLTIYRTLSTFRHPSGLANYLIVSLGFVASDLLLTENKRYKTFLKITIFFVCLVMITTVSRNFLGFLVSLFLIHNHFYRTKNIRSRMIRCISISLIIITFLIIIVLGSTIHILSYKIEDAFKVNHKEFTVNIDYAYDVRLAYKIAAVEMLKRHPFLGVGLAMYPSYVHKLNKENYFSKNFIPVNDPIHSIKYFNFLRVADPHNDILQYLAETGIIGGGAFIFFIATFLYLILINLRKKSTDDRYFKVRLFCFFASFIGVLIDSIDFDVFKIRQVWFLIALILSLIMMYKNKRQDSIN